MSSRIVIDEVSVYHPEKVVNNQYYIEYFQKRGQDISRLLNALGRDNRYVADYERETTLTMAIEASKRVLKKSKLNGKDLDMMTFVSGTPEYFWPPNAVAVHHAVQGKADAIVYDMNVACVGMVVAVDQVSRNMLSNRFVKRALVVGSEQMHRYARKEEAVTYASFGDGACAMILEKTIDRDAGFIDSTYHVNTESVDKIVLPACGVSRMYENNVSDFEKRIHWQNVNNDNGFLFTVEMIEKLLERNHLTIQDVAAYCFSQLSRKNIFRVQEALNEDISKFPIVGTEYGYTGAASPFMALERAVAEGTVKRGDYVVFWSIGAGTSACALLCKY
ncbi:3-oxoacyl-[acyl-carrier-protein] synthase III C-terminal domain-containing protein [Alicyclobacillus dauci]|uniref:Beta-ketoacyl-ACP synthase n=1 Tax=Alicyclobacillus dauci TaxID=1475485 RepID=A0ABY6Z002_9BACL|nr:3-oxoacyl-[acyl-carrier-protein] synthase III C-terminal domain-containing protein [Alicyclobacillus dauci]WAH36218.1 beta-ketoacyl-ACP synthase [Alicyclobacillus dauci]